MARRCVNLDHHSHLSSTLTLLTSPCPAAIIDEESKVKHSKLSEQTEEVINDPAGKLSVKLRQDNVDIAYPPIIQSGGDYDLKVGTPSMHMQGRSGLPSHAPVMRAHVSLHSWEVDRQ